MKKVLLVVCALVLGSLTSSYAENMVLTQAEKAGVKKCLPAVKAISDFIIEKGDVGSHSFWITKNPDKQLFTTTVERDYSDGPLLTNISIAPVSTGECAIVYDQIGFFQKSCAGVAKENFGKYTYKGDLNRNVTILQSDTDVTIYLMPVQGGCVSVKKEVISDGNALK